MEGKKQADTYILSLTAIAALLFLLLRGETVSAQVEAGLALCMNVLIPTLFPALLAAELFLRSGCAALLGRWLSPVAHPLFGLSDSGTGVLLLGLLCGFPLGACGAAAMLEAGKISEKEAARLMLFAHAPSPAFTVLAIGEKLLGNRKAGWILWGCTLLATLSVGFIAQRAAPLPQYGQKRTAQEIISPDWRPGTLVCRAGEKLLRLCGTVLLFAALSAFVLSLSLPASLRAGALLLLELTNGAAAAGKLPENLALPLIAFGAGWNGLSVHSQLSSLGAPVKPLPFIAARFGSGLLSAGFLLLCRLAGWLC